MLKDFKALLIGFILGIPLMFLGTFFVNMKMDSFKTDYKIVNPDEALLNSDVQYGSRKDNSA